MPVNTALGNQLSLGVMLSQLNEPLQQSAHSREMFGAMPLHERGIRSYGRPVNPGEIAFAWLTSVKSCRRETTGLQHLMKTAKRWILLTCVKRRLLLAIYEFLSGWLRSTFTSPKGR